MIFNEKAFKIFSFKKYVLATNSGFLIPTSLQPDKVDLCFFELRFLLDKIGKGLHHHDAKIEGFAKNKDEKIYRIFVV